MKNKTFVDQAATSYPKPETVYQAVDRFARKTGVANNRGNYSETLKVAEIFKKARQGCADFIKARPENIIFSSGTTESMSTLLLGGLEDGDEILISPFEHNAVLRPLQYLKANRGVEVKTLDGDLQTGVRPETVGKALTANTRMCIINHISNAFGVEQDIEAIGSVLKQKPGLFFVVDAAQSIGTRQLDVETAGIDALCFSGHKGLLGPTGTGGFYISNQLNKKIIPQKMGGTGRDAGGEEFSTRLPHKYEVGSQNSWGIAGLVAGIKYIKERGLNTVRNHIKTLTELAVEGLKKLGSVQLYLPDQKNHHGIISFQTNYLPPHDVASLLDNIFNIKVRAGLHCSPLAHKQVGTFPEGTVRISFGITNNKRDVRQVIEALKKLENENK